MTGPLTPYATEAQSLFLKLMARSPRLPAAVPLAVPRTLLHTGSTSVAHLYDDVFCHRSYESPKPLPRTPRIVDAGAHLGMAALFFLARYPDCQLTCFEPNPNLAPLLRLNVARWSERATVHEAALSVQEGKVRFHITQDNPFNVTGGIDNRENEQRMVRVHEVRAMDARECLARHVDLMKLDVEGHEYELLKLELFRPDHISNLVVEFHDIDVKRRQFVETMAALSSRGYRVANEGGVQIDPGELSGLTGSIVLKLY